MYVAKGERRKEITFEPPEKHWTLQAEIPTNIEFWFPF
jgi:hypothetical protein